MCFSPQADIAGGLVICAIGIDAVRHVRGRRAFIALAWLPPLLGAHQLIEALVWLWLQGQVPRGAGQVALWAYLLIAFVVLPVFVPLAVTALEPTRRRRALMAPFAIIGTVVAVLLLAAMIRGPVTVRLASYHLSYGIRVPDGLAIIAAYVVAVCGPLLMSGYRNVVVFGAVNLVAVIVIARLTVDGFASVWCGWAAISSAAIALHCRLAESGQRAREQSPRPVQLKDLKRFSPERAVVFTFPSIRSAFLRVDAIGPGLPARGCYDLAVRLLRRDLARVSDAF